MLAARRVQEIQLGASERLPLVEERDGTLGSGDGVNLCDNAAAGLSLVCET